MMEPRARPPLRAQVTKYFRIGDDRRRRLYSSVRRMLAPKTALRRGKVAERFAASCPFEIPRSRGFAVFPPGHFPETDGIIAAVRELESNVNEDEVAARRWKDFMVPIMDAKGLDLESPFLKFALRRDILESITAYLGTVPVLSNIDVFYSRPRTQSGVQKFGSSQLHHCDGDDTSQIKIFVLCNDVGPENGPLTIMPASTSQRLRDGIHYQYRNRVKDEQAHEVVGEGHEYAVTGPAGTVALVDTSRCFHYGSRIEVDGGARYVAILQYLTPFSFMLPRDYGRTAPYRHLARLDMPELIRMVLGAE